MTLTYTPAAMGYTLDRHVCTTCVCISHSNAPCTAIWFGQLHGRRRCIFCSRTCSERKSTLVHIGQVDAQLEWGTTVHGQGSRRHSCGHAWCNWIINTATCNHCVVNTHQLARGVEAWLLQGPACGSFPAPHPAQTHACTRCNMIVT